jgi:hypothetical protein
MEQEALILRARVARAKIAAEYATNAAERERYKQQARAYEQKASAIEDGLQAWSS